MIIQLDLLSTNSRLGLKTWRLPKTTDLGYFQYKVVQLPPCEICQRKLLSAKISYYSLMFQAKVVTIRLLDIMDSYTSFYDSTTVEREIPKKFVHIQPSLDHFKIQRIVRTKKREAEETQHHFINACLDVGNELIAVSNKHYEEWDILIEKWIDYHRTHMHENSGTGLSEHNADLRELHVYFEWILQLYRLKRLVKQQAREIRSLNPLKITNDYPEELSPLYEYYENIYNTLINNTLYLMNFNLDKVSHEIISTLSKSSLALRNNQFVTLVHVKSLSKARRIMMSKYNIVPITTNAKFKKLKNNLIELWYDVPKSSLKKYSTSEPTTVWTLILDFLEDFYAWFKDWLQNNRRRLDRLLHTPLH